MVKFITGKIGEGKTKELIDMANKSVRTTDGHLVFIDNTRRYIYDLHYDIRFIDTEGFPISDYKELFGFICGILSQDSDISDIFIDGLARIVTDISNENLLNFVKKLEIISKNHEVNFIISLSCDAKSLPNEIKVLMAHDL